MGRDILLLLLVSGEGLLRARCVEAGKASDRPAGIGALPIRVGGVVLLRAGGRVAPHRLRAASKAAGLKAHPAGAHRKDVRCALRAGAGGGKQLWVTCPAAAAAARRVEEEASVGAVTIAVPAAAVGVQ